MPSFPPPGSVKRVIDPHRCSSTGEHPTFCFFISAISAWDVVAHQEEFVYVVLVGRMHCYLGWWEREDQPAMTCIDRLVPEHVSEECSVNLRIRAVEDDVSTVNHARQYIPFGPRGSTVSITGSLHPPAPAPTAGSSGRGPWRP